MPRLTDDQIRQLVEAFYRCDIDNDDYLDRNELYNLFESLKLVDSPEKLLAFIKKANLEKDRLDKRDVLQVIYEEQAQQQQQQPGFITKQLMGKMMDATNTKMFFSNMNNKAEEVVIEVKDPDDSDGDSDYEYYTYSSDEDNDTASLLGEGLKVPEPQSPTSSVHSSAKLKQVPDVQPNQELKRSDTKQPKARGRRLPGSEPSKSALNNSTAPKLQSQAKKPTNSLADPKVRKQLASIKFHEPYFLRFVSTVQIILFAYEIYHNGGLESIALNPFGGPSGLTLIQLGAKYGPCMRADSSITADFATTCNEKYTPSLPRLRNGSCMYFDNLAFICGMNGFQVKEVPDQVWRLVTPIFLHTGVVHLAFNLLVQFRIGFRLESQLGSPRMMAIYLISGIGGYILAALLSPNNPTVGSSGALYGMFAIMYLDVFQSWPILKRPYRDLGNLTITVLVALAVGLLPYIDNYAHIGGFISGMLSGFILMPSIKFGKVDMIRKRILAILAIPLLIVFWANALNSFFSGAPNPCPWCVYLDCLPLDAPWCKSN